MALPFETEGTILTQENADHINKRHVLKPENGERTAKFDSQINIVDLLKTVSELTWEENSKDVYILQEGWKPWHGHFRLFAFNLNRQIGVDPDDFPAKHIAVYYSEKVPGEKWEIITAFPFNFAYYAKFQGFKHR